MPKGGKNMDKTYFIKKILVLLITVLFVGISTLAIAENIKTGKNASFENTKTNFQMTSNKGAPIPFFSGTMGNNNWYISEVRIMFQYNPSDVAEIYYKMGGGNWIKYTGQFTISQDGSYYMPWYWVDKNGTRWNEPALEFKIDQTPPTITLNKQTMTNDRVKFTATANDATSGLEKVEFYLDDEIQTTITAPPYEWIWQGTTNHIVKAIAYDYAGHMKESNELGTPYPGFSIPSSPVNKPVKKLLH